MRRPQDTLVRELLKLCGRPEVISFAGGLPASEGFAVEAMRRAADEVLSQMPVRALQYSYTEGDPILRQAIADFETSRGTPTSADEVMIVTGSQQAIDLIARSFIDAGSRVLVENPTYMGALQTFRNASPEFVPLPHDEEGLNPAAIDSSFAGARFAYVMPTYANPTGMTLSEERRIALCQKARELDLWLVEDDPYGELWYDKPAPKSLRHWAPERTLRLGTLSKTLAPGLRIGYVCGPKEALNVLSLLKQTCDLHTSTFAQLTAARVFTSGALEEHLPQVRALYKRQAQAMLEALEAHMPEGITWTRVEGGMFLWMTLPETVNTTALFKRAIDAGVAFVPGQAFYAAGDDTHHMRLSFATVPVDKICTGVERLAGLLRAAL